MYTCHYWFILFGLTNPLEYTGLVSPSLQNILLMYAVGFCPNMGLANTNIVPVQLYTLCPL